MFDELRCRAAMTGYDSGPDGWWLGNDGGTPKFSIGAPSGQKLTWNGSTLAVTGDIRIGVGKSFTPSWFGFSTAPSGDLLYANLGQFAAIWPDGQLTGTSDATTCGLSGVPAEIRPSNDVICPVLIFNSSVVRWGTAEIETDGDILFGRMQVVGSEIGFSSVGWGASGTKGLAAGAFMIYPLT